MSPSADSARDDLAYLRALVQPDEVWQRRFAQAYAAAGLCYGTQFLLHGAQALGVLPSIPLLDLTIGLGPTVIFLVLVILIHRPAASEAAGVTSRAVGSVFSAIGLANLAAAAVVGSVALRQHSLTIWLIFPCVVMVFQGAAWMVAYTLRRKRWLAVVASGWFATGVVAGLCIGWTAAYLAVAGAGFLLFMLVPGWLMVRQAQTAA